MQGQVAGEPADALLAGRHHHMFDAAAQQLLGGSTLLRWVIHSLAKHFAELFSIGFDQPGRALQAGAQGLAAAVQRHLEAKGLQPVQ